MWPFRFAMRRKRGLPHMVVYLLSSSPKNGVELMDGVESITRGWWRPTPGSIYPLLKEMSDQGIVTKRDDGKYDLTPKGRSQFEGSFAPRPRWPQTTDDMVTQMQSFVSYMEDVKRSKSGELEPHRSKLRSLAKRLSDLAGEEGN
jgi:DNA-binding PadR family transcriptional regulator